MSPLTYTPVEQTGTGILQYHIRRLGLYLIGSTHPLSLNTMLSVAQSSPVNAHLFVVLGVSKILPVQA